jgi:hypothetical protein
MANQTTVVANFQARDWEFIVGITGSSVDADMQDVLYKLNVYYDGLPTKPAGQDVINISTVEGVVISIYQSLCQVNTGVSQTNNGQPFDRIRAAILALNNIADNYILDTITAIEEANNTTQGSIRKAGRRRIMMKEYDNN